MTMSKRSELFAGLSVGFPPYTGERVYMREFVPSAGLPVDLARWQPTVDRMLASVNAPGSVYLMVDQSEVQAGRCHRRPGLHVDGYWWPGTQAHGPSPGTHVPSPPGHRPHPAPQPDPGRHLPAHRSRADLTEGLIIAASVEGCEAWDGEWGGRAGAGGDCSEVPIASLSRRRMVSGVAWLGETGSLLHSALPLPERALRTVVRLNVPGWSPGP